VDHGDAVSVEVDPRYAERYEFEPVTPPLETKPTGKEKPAPESTEDRVQRVAMSLAEYWCRALKNAWLTVFPPGTVADIRARWARSPNSKETNVTTQTESTCSQCDEVKPDVRERTDPFEEDVNNRTVRRALCDACEALLAEEI
jgi:hypothetical protein